MSQSALVARYIMIFFFFFFYFPLLVARPPFIVTRGHPALQHSFKLSAACNRGCVLMTSQYHNFNNTIHTHKCEHVVASNVEHVRKCILSSAKANKPIHAVGNGYSFNSIASEEDCILLNLSQHVHRIITVDKYNLTVTVEAGITIQNLCEGLSEHHMALSNIPHFGGMTLGAAVATGIHGTCGKTCIDTFSSSLLKIHLINGRGVDVYMTAKQSATLGLYGIICTVTMRIVPLYTVSHRASLLRLPALPILEQQACASYFQSTEKERVLQRLHLFHKHVLADTQVHDFVMYKYLLGNFTKTCMKETFDIIQSPTISHGLILLQQSSSTCTDISKSCTVHGNQTRNADVSHDEVDSIHHLAGKLLATTKTLIKYYFPAQPILTNGPWQSETYVFLCERNQTALYFEAMMGACTITLHAEVEWAIPIEFLPDVLSEIEDCMMLNKQKDSNTVARNFWNQPIECHIRFSPLDTVPGHAAYHARTKQPLFEHEAKQISYAWVNLNVRQHIEHASNEFRCIEQIFMKYNGRPHWSKCWSGDLNMWEYVKKIHCVYLHTLKQQCAKHDPQQLFHRHHFAEMLLH
jgi:hypothetical protein